MRNRLPIICFCLILSSLSLFERSGQILRASDREIEHRQQPNILFLFADDFAFDCTGFAGNTRIETPTLDQLARRGTVFSHAYNMGGWNGAVCLASRAMLNTGQTVWRANLKRKQLKTKFVDPQLMWSQRLASAGYKTYMTGKWHVSFGANELFDVAKDVRPGMPNQTKAGYHRPKSPTDTTWSPSDPKFEGYWKGGEHWSEIVANNTIEFIDDAQAQDKPFFMYVAFNAPHDPRQSPQEFVDKYPPESIKLPQPFLGEYPFDLPMKRIRDEILAPFPRTPYAVRVNRAEYYAIISHLDQQIDRILTHLKRRGLHKNTIIVFTADHGLSVGHHGLMGKQNLYDHSMRVPFIVNGTGIETNRVLSNPIYLQDVMPTTLDWAGVKKDKVEFKSLKPLLDGQDEKHHELIYGAYTKTQRCIVKDDFKLIVYPTLNRNLLFNLKNDPFETTDLSDDPNLQKTVATLSDQLAAEQVRLNDPIKSN